ncbi:MAG TPA: thioredoxin domain-containing protein [Acidobacteriaceae bacterium]|jgi:protein-disulfide isomerase|nr:thioredoxin domain-containing protein [Acidobacteriaceae bacterium]
MCLAAVGGLGCRAQTPPAGKPLTEVQLDRRIEVIVRAQFNLPPDVIVHIERSDKRDLPGFHIVTITLTQGTTTSEAFPFELSDDGLVFAHMERYDLTKDPSDAVPTTGRPVRGPADAPVTIVVFDDLECPYCSQMYHQLFPDATERYKDKIRIIYRDFPLQPIHPWAMHAAVDANCLLAQSVPGYWDYVDYAHTHGADITGDNKPETAFAALDKRATDEGTLQKVNLDVLKACVAKQDATAVLASIDQGHAMKVEPTPTLFINGEKLEGAVPEDQLWQVIDRALVAQGIAPPPSPPPAK